MRHLAIVTGASSGLGLEIAAQLATKGEYIVVLACRSTEKARAAAETIIAAHPNDQKNLSHEKYMVTDIPCDLENFDSIRAFAAAVCVRFARVDLLVNNAGVVLRPEENIRKESPPPVSHMVAVNYLGPYLLTRLLETRLIEAKGRVVNVTSSGARWYNFAGGDIDRFFQDPSFATEGLTKLMVILHAFELQRRLGCHGVTAVAADPGYVHTNISRHYRGVVSGSFWRRLILRIQLLLWNSGLFISPPQDGATSILHAATVPWNADHDKGALRYYARGLFATRWMTWDQSRLAHQPILQVPLILGFFFPLGIIDWLLRLLSGGKLNSQTRAVAPPSAALDERTAQELWVKSAQLLGLPVDVQLPKEE